MIADYAVSLATPDDIPGVVALQEANLPQNGGTLSVRQSAEWFLRTMLEMPLVVARRDGVVVGYVVATSLSAQAHVPIVQAMLCAITAPPNCYLSGPICIAERDRGKGLAGAMFDHLCASLPGRAAMIFVRADNVPSLQAHRKMGFKELGHFMTDGVPYVAASWTGGSLSDP